MKLFFIGAVFLFFACNGQKKATMENDSTGLQMVVSDDHSGAEFDETLIIRDEEALKLFYSKINMTRKPGLPVPEIDFKNEMVVITCLGERDDSSQPKLRLKKETATQMVLSTEIQTEKTTSHAITSPFSLYKMPLTDKELIFEKAKQ